MNKACLTFSTSFASFFSNALLALAFLGFLLDDHLVSKVKLYSRFRVLITEYIHCSDHLDSWLIYEQCLPTMQI